MPNYANHLFRYDHYENRRDEEPTDDKNQRRIQRTSRRRSRKRTACLTINARRARRWAW
ncbi:hypothetical protein [Botrimarina sp.]|uniref:hypothetical protein n=1 Tax=Botrimarina sp. TaxID=2795802 RepID=UPI0032EAFBED